MTPSTTRRTFLSLASTSIAAATISRASRAVGNSPSDKLTVGVIGCGGRGNHDANLFKNVANVELAYLCDVDEVQRARTAQSLGVESSRVVSDLRRILDDKSIDAVLIATPDHWHSIAAIMACDAGKHVYVEKPISHNIRESRLLIDAAARNHVHVQHGTQCRSTTMMIEAVKVLREGKIGDVLAAKCWNIQRRGSIGHDKPSAPPAHVDYDTWLGPVTAVPFQSNRFHINWRWWHHFGTGDMGNDGVHDLDYTRWGLGVDTHPSKIAACGGKYFFDDDQEFPDTQQVTFEYPGDGAVGHRRLLIYEQRLWSNNYPYNADSGAEFYGTKGQMFLSRRGKVEVRDDSKKLVELSIKSEPPNDQAHVQNFCDAIRSGTPLNADALTGHLSTSLCHLGNIAVRVGRSLTFNPQTEQIVGDDEASALVHRPYRDHWAKPKGA